jgi:site-specific DNA recombinase
MTEIPTPSTSNNTEAEPAVIYLRVSSKEQAQKGGEAEGYSIPAQREACNRKAASLTAVVIEQFVERGESAKTADRPELQRMLQFVQDNHVKYVIVHKVDRLARNREDDITINVALRAAGAQLVSVSENIDETPSGLLLHGIMSSIAEFYSRNLATEVTKGLVQKAKNGGTPYRAPIGYLNVRRIQDSREFRTVEVDPVRGPLMKWAFETYATGDWTIRQLLAELTRRGLKTYTGKSLTVSHLHTLLRHPYYMGLMPYQGVLYPGKHDRLVPPETWYEVQKLLTAKNLAGEKQREHPHYLKGSIYCGQCGERLIIHYAKGRGGVYPYFICVGRQTKRTNCKQRALRIEKVEEYIAAYYATVQLPETELATLKAFLGEELTNLRLDAEHERKAQTRRLGKLEDERQKLLQAHYADAVPLDLLKSEQARLTAEISGAESRLVEIEADFKTAETNLHRALTRAGDCEAAYREATSTMRRQFNLAFYERILIWDDYTVKGELKEPFKTILGDQLRQAVVARQSEALTDAVEEVLRREIEGPDDQSPQALIPVGSGATSAHKELGGSSATMMVRMRGLEPPRPDGHGDLNAARLPIPPHPRVGKGDDIALRWAKSAAFPRSAFGSLGSIKLRRYRPGD